MQFTERQTGNILEKWPI